MNISLNSNYTLKNMNTPNRAILKTSKSPSFSGREARIAMALKSAPGIRQFATRVVKETSDDVAKAGIRKFTEPVMRLIKKGIAYCTALIAASVLFVKNIGDDLKARSKTRIKPIALTKDIVKKATTHIKDHLAAMDDVSYAASKRLEGPGLSDFIDRGQSAVSSAVGVDIKKSTQLFAWNRIKELFN